MRIELRGVYGRDVRETLAAEVLSTVNTMWATGVTIKHYGEVIEFKNVNVCFSGEAVGTLTDEQKDKINEVYPDGVTQRTELDERKRLAKTEGPRKSKLVINTPKESAE